MATLAANALITEAELEELLQTTFETAYANALINIASQFIENFCDRKFIETTYDEEVYDGNGTRDLYLKNYPISDVSTVVVKSWDTFNDVVNTTFTVDDDYLIYDVEGLIYKRGGWVRGRQKYRVTYKAGYAIANVPYDLKQACSQICQYVNYRKSNPGADEETMGRYSISYSDGSGEGSSLSMAVPNSIIALLEPYRRIEPDGV